MNTDDREPSYGASAVRFNALAKAGEWLLAQFMGEGWRAEPWRQLFPTRPAFSKLRDLGLLRYSWDEIALTPEQDAEAIKWAGRTPELEAEARMRARARLHVERHLVKVEDVAELRGRCYRVGAESYRRADGHPVTDDDVMAALLMTERGQENYVSTRGRDQFQIRWACDSSD